MAKLKDFFNKISNNNRIFTAEDIGEMSSNEFSQNEKAINYQMGNLGIPRRNDLINNTDVIKINTYTKSDGTEVKSHYRSRNEGLTGAAANLTGVDKEFDKPLNYHIKNFDTGIPNIENYSYYNNLNNKLEHEVGDFLRQNTNSPKLYSNDIRHQYTSALYTRNLGEKAAKWLGDLNEKVHFSNTGSGAYDTNLDQLNNEIGRNYAKKYPNLPREQLLQIMLNDWENNSQYTRNILKK